MNENVVPGASCTATDPAMTVSGSAIGCVSCGAMVPRYAESERTIDDLYQLMLCIFIFLIVAWIHRTIKSAFVGM